MWSTSLGRRVVGPLASLLMVIGGTSMPLAESGAAVTHQIETDLAAGETAAASTVIYLSLSDVGTVGGFAFADEDVLRYDVELARWDLLFDGSRAGIERDLNGLELISGPDGVETIRMSLRDWADVPGVGRVDDSDIIEFTPTGFGAATAGRFELLLDGSDVGLIAGSEDVDALTTDSNGAAVLSTIGSNRVPGTDEPQLRGRDEDLLRLDNAQFGPASAGTFSTLFDGSSAGIAAADITSAWVDPETEDIYLTGLNGFNTPVALGDGADVFVYGPGGFRKFFDGGTAGLGGLQIDALHIDLGEVAPVVRPDPAYKVYVSSDTVGVVDGITFNDEDILEWDSQTRRWSMFFDGSQFGLAEKDIDAIDLRSDGSLAISLYTRFGKFDDSDILLVTVVGELELLIDGSTVGLTRASEDVSAIAQTEDGVMVSTDGIASLRGVGMVRDEDLIVLSDPAEFFLDGSDVGLGPEDILGASRNFDGLFVSVRGQFRLGDVTGDGNDIVRFGGTFGPASSGSFQKFWDGDEHGFSGEQIDALHVAFSRG